MLVEDSWLNPTRAVGLTSYGVAAVCCAMVWATQRKSKDVSLAMLLTLIESFLFLDIAFNWRWLLHQQFMKWAQGAGAYQSRRLPQLIAILVIVGLLGWPLRWAWSFYHAQPAALLAVAGAALSLAVWFVEAISLHAVDRVFYSHVGGLMMVSFLWILTSLATSLGVWLSRKRAV